MSLDGLISASALFHDRDGTTTLKVVSLESAASYNTGKVAIVTGTCNATGTVVDLADVGYMQADGTTVGWSDDTQIRRIAFSASPSADLVGNAYMKELKIASKNGAVSLTDIPVGLVGTSGTPTYTLTAKAGGLGTASFSIVIYGD